MNTEGLPKVVRHMFQEYLKENETTGPKELSKYQVLKGSEVLYLPLLFEILFKA